MSLPTYLQSSLWSYDLAKMDKEGDARLIITQVLNYGDKRSIDWLFSNYAKDTIRDVLLHPSRGVWFREKLRKWLGFFDLMIDPLEFETAVFELAPRVKLHEAFYQRKGLRDDEVLSSHIRP